MQVTNGPCAICGQPLDDAGRCANCEMADTASLRRHKFVLPVLALIIIAGFSFTRMVVQWFDGQQERLASGWRAKGVSALRGHRAEQAVEDLETALAYAKQDKEEYRLQLAQALLAAGRSDEARSRLLDLWAAGPSNAMVNLTLARLEAARGDLQDAVRYYRGAINGVWGPEANAFVERLNARFELASQLATNRQTGEADAELTAIAGELPPDAGLHLRLAQVLLQAGSARRAISEFQQSKQIDRQYTARAEAGTGAAELQLGDATAARKYLTEAVRLDPRDGSSKQLLVRAEMLLVADPFSPGVSSIERARRTLSAYQTAADRLRSCVQARGTSMPSATQTAPGDPLVGLQSWAAELQPYARDRKLQGRDDVVENMMRFVFATEDETSRLCGPPHGADELLADIGHHRWRNQ